jgi:hypothetical protein
MATHGCPSCQHYQVNKQEQPYEDERSWHGQAYVTCPLGEKSTLCLAEPNTSSPSKWGVCFENKNS